ncbi:MAG: helix-turn-helix domain-containing protein [Vicinamibacteria bacterium]|nr:helix-turn-helix domain-containing protein [Vicinamibacteria bacterium]
MSERVLRPRVWAIGGGKGGVGRSLLAAGMGWHLGRAGRRVLLVDADPCGSNLHNCLGLPRLSRAEAVETGFPGLLLLSNAVRPLASPEISVCRKMRYLMRLRGLAVDIVIVDLGTGPADHIVDVFCIADLSLLVVVPEPSAVERTFEFMRFALNRRMLMRLPAAAADWMGLRESAEGESYDPADLYDRVERQAPQHVEALRRALEGFKPWIALNGVRGEADIALGHQLVTSCARHLAISAVYAGFIHHDETVHQASRNRRLFLMETPTGAASQDVRQLADSLLRGEGLSAEMSTASFLRGDHYQTLGLKASATSEHVEKAFRYLMELYGENALSTFSLVDTDAARRVRAHIKEAYEVLRHPVRRLEYDTRHGYLATSSSTQASIMKETKHDTVPNRPRLGQEALPDPVTGAALRAYRESRGIGLNEIAENSKVALRYLQYIEQDRHKFLPAPVYLRGFLQEYARVIGLDPRRTADAYLARVTEAR